MIISEMICMLRTIQEQQGDIEVVGDHGLPEIEVLEENEEFGTCLYIG